MPDPIKLRVIFDDGTTKDVQLSARPKGKGEHIFDLTISTTKAGTLKFSSDYNEWQHDGRLSASEQIQLAGFIQNYTDTEWDN